MLNLFHSCLFANLLFSWKKFILILNDHHVDQGFLNYGSRPRMGSRSKIFDVYLCRAIMKWGREWKKFKKPWCRQLVPRVNCQWFVERSQNSTMGWNLVPCHVWKKKIDRNKQFVKNIICLLKKKIDWFLGVYLQYRKKIQLKKSNRMWLKLRWYGIFLIRKSRSYWL